MRVFLILCLTVLVTQTPIGAQINSNTWTCGYEVALLRAKSPLGPWELVSR